MTTIGDAISELRGLYKLADQDSNHTDRFLYALIHTPAATLMRRQDAVDKLLSFNGIFQPLDYVELIDVDRIAASCLTGPSGCTFKRTRERLPDAYQGYFGPLLRSVTSLDISQDCQRIYPTMWGKMASQKNFKYNFAHYYWYVDGYLFFPNVQWEAVSLEGIFQFGVVGYGCADTYACRPRQDSPLSIPDYMFTDIKAQIRQDLGVSLQIPADQGQDNKHPLN